MTKIERELLAECRTIAAANGFRLADVIRDCHRFWIGSGRALVYMNPVAKAAAAAKLVARIDTLDVNAN